MGAVIAIESPIRKMQYSYSETAELLPQKYSKLLERKEEQHKEVTLALFHWLITQVGFHLDLSAANVLRFIVARTYGYYKEAELISVRQMRDGVWDIKSSKPLCCPVIKDERTTRKALTVLERLGYITRHRVTINNVDALSLVQVHAEKILKDEHTKEDEIMLRQRRKDKEIDLQEVTENGDTALKPSILRGVQKCSTALLQKCSTEYINKEDIKKPSCSVPRNALRITRTRNPKNEIDCKYDTAKEAIEKAVARVTNKREAKVRRAAAHTGFVTLSEFNATWQSVMIATFGSCTLSGLTHKEYGMLKRIAKTHTLNCTWREFLEWVVTNWRKINRESREFSDYKKKKHGDWSLKEEDRIFLGTDSPDTFMFVKNFGKLVKRFAQAQLSGVSVVAEESAEVIQLRKELETTRRQAAIGKTLLDKVLAAPMKGAAHKPVTRKPVKIVNPDTDTFFKDVDSDLPDWK